MRRNELQQLIDLSHKIEMGMPLFPGTPEIKIKDLHIVARDGFAEKQLLFTTHVGTHLDAPAHMLAEGPTLDSLPIDNFWGKARVLDVRGFKGSEIPADFIRKALGDELPEFLLFYTGFAELWGKQEYFGDYPVLSRQAAELIAQSSVKGIGLDAPSVDAMDAEQYVVHHTLFNAGKIIVENMNRLEQVLNKDFYLGVFPLKVKQADGMPVRAVAILME